MTQPLDPTGHLEDHPLPLILHQLFAGRSTGTLRLVNRVGKHEVFLREGHPVAVTLPGSAELLGKVLVEMGILDDATYKRTVAEAPAKGQRYGEMLVAKKLVTTDQIRLALKAQVRRKLHRLFFLGDGEYTFEAGEHNQGMQGGESLKVHPFRALYHGVRSAWSAERLGGALFLLDKKAIKCTISSDEVARYGVGADDGRVAELLRKGYWTLPDLVDASGLPAQPVHAMVYAFYITDALDIRGADEVPRLKRRAGDPPAVTVPKQTAPTPESSGAWRLPSGNYAVSQSTPPGGAPRTTPGAGVPVKAAFQPTRPTTPSGGTPLKPVIVGPPQPAPAAPGMPPTRGAQSLDLAAAQLEIESARKQLELKARLVEAENLFEVLGVPNTATAEEIKAAYFEAAKRYHPDRVQSMGLEKLRPDQEKIFRRVTEAYNTLYDDAKRAEYVKTMASGSTVDQAHQEAMKVLEAEMAFRRGEIALRKNDYLGAIKDLESAVQNNPKEGEHLAYLTWAKLCAQQINHTQAKPQFLEATRLSPKCGRAFYFLGICLKEEKDVDKAYQMFRKAQELDPRLIDAEREMRVINMRREKEKSQKGGLFDRFRKK